MNFKIIPALLIASLFCVGFVVAANTGTVDSVQADQNKIQNSVNKTQGNVGSGSPIISKELCTRFSGRLMNGSENCVGRYGEFASISSNSTEQSKLVCCLPTEISRNLCIANGGRVTHAMNDCSNSYFAGPRTSKSFMCCIPREQNEEEQSSEETTNTGNKISKLRIMAKNVTELREIISRTESVNERALTEVSTKKAEVLRNQNKVRVAVHALFSMEAISGNIGKNVSRIARAFNNSVQKTINAELKIKKRSPLQRFFIGGDEKSAEEIEQEVNKNKERLENLKQLKGQTESSLESIIDQQIAGIREEQKRLVKVAQKEKKWKGILGWIWK